MRYLLLMFCLMLALITACTPHAKPTHRPLVACSLVPQATFLKALCADDIDVMAILPPGAEPEHYEPSVQQMQAINRAQLYFAIGHPHFLFEQTWLPKIAQQNKSLTTVRASDSLRFDQDDPHFWLSPRLMRQYTQTMAADLIKTFPQYRDPITVRENQLLQNIDTIDRHLQIQLAPYKGRTFLVFHPAWGYFARDYGLVQLAVSGEHTSPGMAQMQGVLKDAKLLNVKAIFVQPQYDVKLSSAVANALHIPVIVADPESEDWFNSLPSFGRQLVHSWTN